MSRKTDGRLCVRIGSSHVDLLIPSDVHHKRRQSHLADSGQRLDGREEPLMSPMDSALEVVGLRDAHVISVDEPLLIPVYLEPTEGSPLGQEMGSSGV